MAGPSYFGGDSASSYNARRIDLARKRAKQMQDAIIKSHHPSLRNAGVLVDPRPMLGEVTGIVRHPQRTAQRFMKGASMGGGIQGGVAEVFKPSVEKAPILMPIPGGAAMRGARYANEAMKAEHAAAFMNRSAMLRNRVGKVTGNASHAKTPSSWVSDVPFNPDRNWENAKSIMGGRFPEDTNRRFDQRNYDAAMNILSGSHRPALNEGLERPIPVTPDFEHHMRHPQIPAPNGLSEALAKMMSQGRAGHEGVPAMLNDTGVRTSRQKITPDMVLGAFKGLKPKTLNKAEGDSLGRQLGELDHPDEMWGPDDYEEIYGPWDELEEEMSPLEQKLARDPLYRHRLHGRMGGYGKPKANGIPDWMDFEHPSLEHSPANYADHGGIKATDWTPFGRTQGTPRDNALAQQLLQFLLKSKHQYKPRGFNPN